MSQNFGSSGWLSSSLSSTPFIALPLLLFLPRVASGLELGSLELLFDEVVIQQDDIDGGVEFGAPELVHLVLPE